MLVVTSSTQTTEEVPTELDLRLEFHHAEEAEQIAKAEFEESPTLSNFQACKEASVWVIDASNALMNCLLAKVLP